MGYILNDEELGPQAGEYHGEVRSESFYLKGQSNFVRKGERPCPSDCSAEGPHTHGDWGYVKQRHAIFLYPENDDVNQGSIEILIEDIPKIRAVLDAIESYVRENRGGVPWETVHADDEASVR